MSRINEKQTEKKDQSAVNQEFYDWHNQKFLDEAAELIKELGEDSQIDNLEPSESDYLEIVQKAKMQGLFRKNEKDDLVETQEKANQKIETEKEIIELSDSIKRVDEADYESSPSLPVKQKFHHPKWRTMAMKWVAVLAMVLMGVFGVSMSSQANRTFVMQKVDELFGNDEKTKVNNTNEILKSSTQEEDDRKHIADTLNTVVPTLFYVPAGMEYNGYKIEENAQTAYMEYTYQGKHIHFFILANYKDASGIFRNDIGTLLEFNPDNLSNVDMELWKVEEDGDALPSYLLQWDYKNSYYRISGKIDVEEIKKIAENIVY